MIVKGSTCLFRSSLFLILLLFSSFLSAQESLPTVAVIDFEGRGIAQLEAQTLTDRFRSSINNTGAVRLVERNMMEEVLQEQGFQQAGCTSDECAIEVGQLLGVQNMIGGAIGKVGNTFTIDLRMIAVETGTAIRTQNVSYAGMVDGLIVEIEVLAYKIMEMEPPQDVLERRRTGMPVVTAPLALKVKTRAGAMMRSLVFPGFGQFYSERKVWGFGWILGEVIVAGVIYTNYTTYQTAYDDYKRFKDLYNSETDVVRIAEYKNQARESHDNMDMAYDQIKVFSIAAGGIWMANVLHALIVGPKRQSSNVYKEPALSLVYDPDTHLTQLRWTFALD